MSRESPLRVSGQDGAILAVPPLEQAASLLERNRELFARISGTILGRPLSQVRALARREAVHLAHAYCRHLDEPVPDHSAPATLLVAGHQPELFHPGVWVKNFALAGLAFRNDGVALNLIVDADNVKSTTIPVPVPGTPLPRLESFAFDTWQGESPWEERTIVDQGQFERFGDEVSTRLRDWGFEPLLATYWPLVRAAASRQGDNLGEAFAAARRQIERDWGCHNLELPLSHLCRGEAFALVAGELLRDLPRIVSVYNHAVGAYRQRYRLRSRNHPVPDLSVKGDWCELPLWGWRRGQARRGRLFASLLPDRVRLRVGEEVWPDLPSPSAPEFLIAWRSLEASGYKVRSRALLTTLFARLFLGDLFLHGIGGGKYDELTDDLMRRWWGVTPPGYMILSATRLLPISVPDVTQADRDRLAHVLRDVQWNPQRHLSAEQRGILGDVLQQREHLLHSDLRGLERLRQFRALRDALLPAVEEQQTELRRELARTEELLAVQKMLQRRDFPFCLYPAPVLRSFYSLFV